MIFNSKIVIIQGCVYHEEDVIVFSGTDQYENIWIDEIGDFFPENNNIGIDIKEGYIVVKQDKLDSIRKATRAEEMIWKLETEGDSEEYTFAKF